MTALWIPTQEAQYQRLLHHIETCTSCDLRRADDSALECPDMQTIRRDLRQAGEVPS